MFSRLRPFRSGGLWRPSQNQHSLEYLKYLYGVLNKNKTVTASNRETLIEALRAMSEILIWGDQNDGSVFDFFLEKNMLEFFLHYMEQKSAQFVCVQLLQTLNILFENIRNETSLYYLLSNNHINSIIVHKFDFSDEEVLAYYISFLKTLSLKLNQHTIHFFYNEHTNDFPLYTEAIKFFNHSESMVRIAVRTLSLNVYKVPDASMLKFIKDHTAAPYFSNFVWFVGNHILEIDSAIRNDSDHSSRDRLSDLVAEHLDHLHYLNDILRLEIDSLNDVLTDHLLDRLFLPLYIQSLFARTSSVSGRRSRLGNSSHQNSAIVTHELALYLLTQVFLIITHPPLVRQLADIIFNTDIADLRAEKHRDGGDDDDDDELASGGRPENRFSLERPEPLEEVLPKLLQSASAEAAKPLKRPNYRNSILISEGESESGGGDAEGGGGDDGGEAAAPIIDVEREPSPAPASVAEGGGSVTVGENSTSAPTESPSVSSLVVDPDTSEIKEQLQQLQQELQNITDEEKVAAAAAAAAASSSTVVGLTATAAASSSSLPPLPTFSLTGFTVAPTAPTFHAPYMRKIKDSTGTDLALSSRPYLETIFKALECTENDYDTLFALTLIYAMGHNVGINRQFVEATRLPMPDVPATQGYNAALAERLIFILSQSCKSGSKVRLITLDLAILLLKLMSPSPSLPSDAEWDGRVLDERHVGLIESARGEAVLYVRNFYKSEDLFLDMFEDEYREMKARPLNVSFLCMDASVLLPPIGTPLSGIEFVKRLPCGESERARRAIRVFLYLRDVTLHLNHDIETALPLTKESELVRVNDVLDLNNSDLIACTVIMKEGKLKRFLVIGADEVILVEPDTKRLGWGMATFVGLLQDTEVEPDKEDTRSLYVTVHRRSQLGSRGSPARSGASGSTVSSQRPLLSARLVFDDHIRCMAARQRLSKGRHKARQRKMHQVARLLELSSSKMASSGNEHTQRSRRPGGVASVTSTAAIAASSSSSGTAHRPGSASSSSQRQMQLDRIRGLHASSQRLVKEKGIAMAASSVPSRGEAVTPFGPGWDTPNSIYAVTPVTSSLRYFDHRGIDIEEAEDAALSLQNLDKQEHEGGKKRNESGGSAGSNNLESSEEIPLKDLSKLKPPRSNRSKGGIAPGNSALNDEVDVRSKHRSRSATPPASASGSSSHHRHRHAHRLAHGSKNFQSRSQERPKRTTKDDGTEFKDEEAERLFRNDDDDDDGEMAAKRNGKRSDQNDGGENEEKTETRVSRGRASASSSNVSNASSSSATAAPKSLTPAPIAPVSLIDDRVTISLEVMPLVLPPVPPVVPGGGGGGGGGGGDDTMAGCPTAAAVPTGRFTTLVNIDVVAGGADEAVRGDDVSVSSSVVTTATPDSLKSPPSEATLMSCGSDAASPTAATILTTTTTTLSTTTGCFVVEGDQRDGVIEDSSRSSREDRLCEDMATAVVSDSKERPEFEERRERKGAMLEASRENGEQSKKILSG